jgi:hypothetical protein
MGLPLQRHTSAARSRSGPVVEANSFADRDKEVIDDLQTDRLSAAFWIIR